MQVLFLISLMWLIDCLINPRTTNFHTTKQWLHLHAGSIRVKVKNILNNLFICLSGRWLKHITQFDRWRKHAAMQIDIISACYFLRQLNALIHVTHYRNKAVSFVLALKVCFFFFFFTSFRLPIESGRCGIVSMPLQWWSSLGSYRLTLGGMLAFVWFWLEKKVDLSH